MDKVNQSVESEFVLLGLCHSWNMQVLFLMIFLMLPLTIILGNIFVIILIITDIHLHSPMYFLLANLLFVDMLLSSVTTPKMITDILREMKTISFEGCMCQIFFVHFTRGSEMVLLVVMAYDCYVAICKPLHYSTIMSLQKCIGLVVASWTIGVVHTMSQMAEIVLLPFCGPREIDSFFCDIPLLIKLACMDSYTLGMLMNSSNGVLARTCFALLLMSYTHILFTVCQSSKTGTSEALSTCSAHITVVVLIFIYVWLLSITWVDKFLAMFYSDLTPLLNQCIYTLKYKEIKNAMKKFRSYYIDFNVNI